jgi:hypothetical protein
MSDSRMRCRVLLAALLALLSVAVPSVGAAEFHSEAAHTILDGEQQPFTDDVFTVNAGTVTCGFATYSGTTSSATTAEVTLTPSFELCTAFGFLNTTVDVPKGINGGCDYRYTPTSAISRLHIVCGNNETITVTAFNCWVTIGSQTTAGIVYDNGGSGSFREISITSNITGLTYTQHSKQFPGCTNGTFTNGKFVGSTRLLGTNTTFESVGVWHF